MSFEFALEPLLPAFRLYIYPERQLNALTYKKYLDQINEGLASGVAEIVLDFTNVQGMDTYGLGMLVKGWKLSKAAGVGFKVCNVSHEAIAMILRVTNVEQLVPIEYSSSLRDSRMSL
ncbi:MAG: STAS domain-containing protein [Pseudanabaenaceae cyanobacterium]